jgi:hypothetical protein
MVSLPSIMCRVKIVLLAHCSKEATQALKSGKKIFRILTKMTFYRTGLISYKKRAIYCSYVFNQIFIIRLMEC